MGNEAQVAGLTQNTYSFLGFKVQMDMQRQDLGPLF